MVARIDAPDREAAPGVLAEREVATYPFADDAIVVVLDGITDPRTWVRPRARPRRRVRPC